MKFKSIFNSALLIGLALYLTNCGPESPFIEPEPTELPPITTEGLNTAGCLVNGELWLPKPGGGLKPGIDCEYYPRLEGSNPGSWGVLQLDLARYSNSEGDNFIQVSCLGLFIEGEFPLTITDSSNNRKGKGVGRIWGGGDYRNTTNSLINYINILKLDTVNKIISGTFQFDAINENDDTDTIKIHEGRFDVKFTY